MAEVRYGRAAGVENPRLVTLPFYLYGSTRPAVVVTGPPETVAAALRPVVDLGFRHIVVSLRAPWDHETIARLPEVRDLLQAPGTTTAAT